MAVDYSKRPFLVQLYVQYTVSQLCKILLLRYPEDFISFADIMQYIKDIISSLHVHNIVAHIQFPFSCANSFHMSIMLTFCITVS